MADPLLSIVVPVYNSSETIEECVGSLTSQSINDLEILLIDDGSTDDSLKKCEKLASKDNRIKVFSKENAGQGVARNYGLDLATGEYIAFVDSDDTCTKAMYETLLRKAKDAGSDIVVGGYCDLLNGAVVESHPAGLMELRSKGEIDRYMADLISSPGHDDCAGCIAVWDSVYRRLLIEGNDVQFPSERDVYSEDLVFKLRAFASSSRVSFVPACLYEYHVSDMSYSKRVDDDVLGRINALNQILANEFEQRLDRFDFRKRNAGRAFASLRFSLRRAPCGDDRIAFFDALVNNEKLYGHLSAYQPSNLINKAIYKLLLTRNSRLISVVFNLFALKG